ncbi:DUF1980 domain-containing protein [Bacillus licheniformis]
MVFQLRQFLRALVLAAFSVFIFKLHYTGEIDKLINPKYDYTSLIAAGVFAFLFIIQLTRIWTVKDDRAGDCGCGHDHGESKPFFHQADALCRHRSSPHHRIHPFPGCTEFVCRRQ